MALSNHPVKRSVHTIHHKKRTGTHQKQSKDFMRAYWPYLPLFGIAAVVIIVFASRVLGATGAVIGTVSLVLAGISFLL